MRRCYWKGCSGEVVGGLAHSYAQDSMVWYCADHSPTGDHWHDQTLTALRESADRIACALEEIARKLPAMGIASTGVIMGLRP